MFLDTNVILGYLRGDAYAVQLFSAEASGRLRSAVNAIVLQELLLTADFASLPEFDRIRDHLRVLPLDFAKAEALLPHVRVLRDRLAHKRYPHPEQRGSVRLLGHQGSLFDKIGDRRETLGRYSGTACHKTPGRVVRVYFDTGVFIDYLSTRGSVNSVLRSSQRRGRSPINANLRLGLRNSAHFRIATTNFLT